MLNSVIYGILLNPFIYIILLDPFIYCILLYPLIYSISFNLFIYIILLNYIIFCILRNLFIAYYLITLYIVIYLILYILYNYWSFIGLAGRVFVNGLEDLGSIPGRVIPKTLKMVLDTSSLNTQQYKLRIKGKMVQSREKSSALPYTSV